MLRAFLRTDDGATAIEYALIASIVSLAIISGVMLWSDNVVAMFDRIQTAVAG